MTQATPIPAEDFMAARDPFTLFEAWFADARQHEVNDPNAMSLATVDGTGAPNVRIVLLKGLDPVETGADRGFVFFTNFESAKGRELQAHPRAALAFHWKSLRRQVRVRGAVAPVSAAEADAYYATRPRLSRIGAWSSDQSRPLESRELLEARVRANDARYPGDEIPRPNHWGGFRVVPEALEFWHDRPFRLHDRLVFTREAGGRAWSTQRLFP